MIRSIALICLIAGCYASPLDTGRIVNGTDAKEGEFKYIVSLRQFYSHVCGAAILDSLHILTASHCVFGAETAPFVFDVQYGLTRRTEDNTNAIQVLSITMHPEYDQDDHWANDVAVLKLTREIPIGGNIQPTVLPKQGEATPGDQIAVLAGWGMPHIGGEKSWDLQRVDLTLYNDDDCEAAFPGATRRDRQVCAGQPGKGQCTNDSGGPLTVDGVQWGVVSWSEKPCGSKPGIFANVAMYSDWIMEQTLN